MCGGMALESRQGPDLPRGLGLLLAWGKTWTLVLKVTGKGHSGIQATDRSLRPKEGDKSRVGETREQGIQLP